MPRIMALDVGDRRIGVAVSDESMTFAFPRPFIQRQEGYRRDMAALREAVQTDGIEEIVVGMPIMMDGSKGVQATKIEDFIETLGRHISIPILIQDERLSTSEAEKVLIRADRRRSERKEAVDSMAASLILQTYMDRRRSELTK